MQQNSASDNRNYSDIDYVCNPGSTLKNEHSGSQPSTVLLQQNNRSSGLAALNGRLLQSNRTGQAKPILVNSYGSINASAEMILELAWEISKMRIERILIVDCNFRTPILSRAYNLSGGPGLAEYLLETHTIREIIKKTNLHNVHLIRAGECFVDPVALLTSGRLPELVTIAGRHYDLVLLNTPPYNAYVDTFALTKFLQPAIMLMVADVAQSTESIAKTITELQILDLEIIKIVSST